MRQAAPMLYTAPPWATRDQATPSFSFCRCCWTGVQEDPRRSHSVLLCASPSSHTGARTMSTSAFTTVNNRRAAKQRKEISNGGGKMNEKEKIGYQPIHSAFTRRPNTEWDYRSFAVIIAKADEEAIGAGLEKMISDRRLMASYNWDVDSWIPTIVVPGAPKMFYPWPGGLLQVRNEIMTIDEEAFRMPNSPMEPLFTAVRLCQPDFKLHDIDLVADLNCLKKLLRFVLRAAFSTSDIEGGNGEDSLDNGLDIDRNMFAGANRECDFRIDAQTIGRAVVLMRHEAEHRGRAMGFGVGYMEACTKPFEPDPHAAGPHKRVTFVKFGGLRLLLRHKVLAAIYSESPTNGTVQHLGKSISPSGAGDSGSWPSTVPYSAVRCIRGGHLDDHNALKQIEFASISKERNSPLVIDKWLDMLFVGSDHLYLGEHVRGRFEEPTMRCRAEALELSGMKPSDGRRVLVILEMLLRKIVQYGRPSGNGARGGNAMADGGGDGHGKRRQAPVINESVSFTIISRDECRKLAVYKNAPRKGNNKASAGTGNRLDAPPPCVSESMMAALLADE